MNLFQRAIRSCLRKPVRSILLLLVVFLVSLLFLSGMAGRSANIAVKDSTRQAIGAGFLLEENPENRSRRIEEASRKIEELSADGQGEYDGYHQQKITVNGNEVWQSWTDNSFESLKMEDIEKIAAVEGISDYNITTVPTAVLPVGFERIEDAGTDQTGDLQGVALVGNLDMTMDDNVLGGNVTIKEGRMTTAEDSNVCVISEELAEKNHLEVGDSLRFCPVKEKEPVQEAVIVGIYQVKERMEPYMSGDTYRSENVIFTDLHFPEKVEQDDPLYEKAYFKVADVNEYDAVREAIAAADIDWQRYDLIDNNGSLETMAANFHDLEKINNTLLLVVAGAGFMILFFIFIFWLRSRTHEIGILLSLGIARGKILLQIAAEAFLGGALALALSFLAAPAVSDAAAGYLTDWQAQQDELQAELDAGGTATEYQAPELTVTDVETELTPAMLLTDGLCVGALILLSTGVAGVLILRRKPADILKGE